MTPSVRTAITLGSLLVLLVVAGVWGWGAATEPLPGRVDTPVCVTTEVSAGDRVFPEQVTVSVYNAGTRAGLAGRTMQQLTDQGFAEGESGNVSPGAGVTVAAVEIWSEDPRSPAVQLVRSRLGRQVAVQRREGPGPGVNVIVGDGFQRVFKGRRSVLAGQDTSICSPPVD